MDDSIRRYCFNYIALYYNQHSVVLFDEETIMIEDVIKKVLDMDNENIKKENDRLLNLYPEIIVKVLNRTMDICYDRQRCKELKINYVVISKDEFQKAKLTAWYELVGDGKYGK
jgi:hypothetical protein